MRKQLEIVKNEQIEQVKQHNVGLHEKYNVLVQQNAMCYEDVRSEAVQQLERFHHLQKYSEA